MGGVDIRGAVYLLLRGLRLGPSDLIITPIPAPIAAKDYLKTSITLGLGQDSRFTCPRCIPNQLLALLRVISHPHMQTSKINSSTKTTTLLC